MAEVRIVCVGTGNPLTSPKAQRRENSRAYRYAPPGAIYKWEGKATSPEVRAIDQRLVSAYPGGPEIQGWGLVVLGDTFARDMKPPVETQGMEQPKDWETKIIYARDRARDLLGFWAVQFPGKNYGALIISGEVPTEDELRRAREAREQNARGHLNESIKGQKLAAQGRSGYKRGYSEADRAWASEFGVILPETVDALPKVAREEQRIACPECAEGIMPDAKVCIHCKTKFKMPVREYVEIAALETAKAG